MGHHSQTGMALLLIVCILSSASSAEFSPPALSVPEGFTLELAAAPPLVQYPMMGCLDDRGRLFLAESKGENLDKEGLLKKSQRFIRMLEDTDHDGQFDKSTIFADGLVMPEGALWYRGSLYVLSSPYLWRFEDADGDGVAEIREKLVGYMEFNGKANQHGAYLGPCGRLYFSGGIFGYNLVGSDGEPAYPRGEGSAAGVFSCSPDGTDVEIFCNGGINPVEVVFTAEGEMFTTCPIIDSVGGRHDGLIHWVRGAIVGPKDYRPPTIPQTGIRLTPTIRWGQVAPSGLMRYRGDGFGPDYKDRLFATHFNTRAVVSVRLERQGATYQARDEPFITSPNPDFHPTDILQDADGSLLLIDTGGWFRISCPFSEAAKPEVQGAIYRIRRSDAKPVTDPRGHELDWKVPTDQLVARLDDSRVAVRDRAMSILQDGGDAVLPALVGAYEGGEPSKGSVRLRRNIVWTAARVNTEGSRGLLRTALSDTDPTVRQAATRSVGILGVAAARETLCELLADSQQPLSLRRAAATALGQIGASSSVPSLLAAVAAGGDDFFQHAVRYALIEIGDAAAVASGLAASDPRVQLTALVALEQIDGTRLTRTQVARLLASDDQPLRSTVVGLISRRDGWSEEIIDILRDRVQGDHFDERDAALVRGAIVTYAEDPRVVDLVSGILGQATKGKLRSCVLDSLARLKHWPETWSVALSLQLDSAQDSAFAEEIVLTAVTSGTRQLDAALRRVAMREATSNELRAAAWSCLVTGDPNLPDTAFAMLQQRSTDPQVGPLRRLQAARTLAAAELTPEQLKTLAGRLSSAGSVEFASLVGVFVEREDRLAPETAALLLESLSGSDQLSLLSRHELLPLEGRLQPQHREELLRLVRRLEAEDANLAVRIEELENELSSGDAERGRQVFYSSKAVCSACHRVDGEGGQIGPDLSQVGRIRRRRDLLEAIVAPSSTIVNNYETWSAQLKDGRTATGVIHHATLEILVLKDSQRREYAVARDQIEQLVRQPTSMMPAGLDRNLTKSELADLVRFLESRR